MNITLPGTDVRRPTSDRDLQAMANYLAADEWEAFALTHVTYPSSDGLAGQLIALLSLTPPFAVCALTSSTLIYKDIVSAFLLAGLVLSAAACSVVKKIVKQPRPARFDNDAGEGEYGMPSNHACFAWMMAVFVLLYTARSRRWCRNNLHSCGRRFATTRNREQMNNSSTIQAIYIHFHTTVVVVASIGIAVGCSYSRVHLKYHTSEQVYAGSILGVALGILWFGIFETSTARRWIVWLDSVMAEFDYCSIIEGGCGKCE